ncbi:MAG: protein kinase [Myxococcales bacterium]|nr:protein kinase [Myxococcales bacterium]
MVERFVAGGGMGEVYLARDNRLDRRVAIKLLHAEVAHDIESTGRFQREARVLSRVVHPNVVAIYGFGKHGTAWYIAMEYVDGPSLEEVLDERGHLPLGDAVSVTRQVAGGLAEAHAHGIIHRDIKPGNVLLRKLASGALLAKVVDFGLARAFGGDAETVRDPHVTAANTLLGTPAYMAPEQIQGQPLDGRCDLYALAILSYKMLCGNLPIYRSGMQSLLIAHLVDVPKPLPSLPEAQPQVVEMIDAELQRALAKLPDDRHESVLQFADELERSAGLNSRQHASESIPCPACSHQGQLGSAYCEACGSALPLSHCPGCSTQRRGERYFCVVCGTSLLMPTRRSVREGEAAMLDPAVDVTAATVSVGIVQASNPGELAASFAAAIEREGGRPLAVLGNELIAVFGLGGMRDGEVVAAIDTALVLLRTAEQEGAAIRVGVGLGPVHTRGVGVAWGTAWAGGAAIEQARHASANAAPGELMLTADVWREVRGTFASETAGQYRRVTRHRGRRHRRPTWGFTTGHEVLVARELALSQLINVANRVRRNDTLMVTAIHGAAGCGKSSLMTTLIEQLRQGDGGWRPEGARCSAIGLPRPYEPFADILHAHADLLPSGRLANLPGLADGSGDAQLRRRLDSLSRLMGVGADETVLLKAARPATDAERDGAFEAYAAFLRGLPGPLALVVDDLHHARETTLDLLDHVIRACADRPILVVLGLDASRADELLGRLPIAPTRIVAVEVPPLDVAETRTMLSTLLGSNDVPAGLAEQVREFSDGIPARVEEVVDSLRDEGAIVQRAAGWALESGADIRAVLARSLSDLVRSRIGRLPPAERELIEALAVASTPVPIALLSAMLGRLVDETEVDALCRKAMVVRSSKRRFGAEPELRLRQRIVAEVVGESAPAARAMHERAARWMMGFAGTRPPGFGAMLARHFQLADDHAQATRYLLKAGQEALRAFANRDALEAMRAAVNTAERWRADEDAAEEARNLLLEATLGVAEVGFHVGALDASLEAANQAVQLSGGATPSAVFARSRAAIVQAEVRSRRGDYRGALTALERASDAEEAGIPGIGLAAIAAGRRAMVLLRAGETEASRVLAKDALLRFEDAVPTQDVQNGLGRLRTVLGHLATRRRDLDAAVTHYHQARGHHDRGGDRVGAAIALLSVGNAAYIAQDLGRAEQVYRDVAALCQAIDYLQGVATARTNLGNVLLDNQRINEALAELIAAETAMRRMDALDTLPETLRLIALCRLALGDLAAAVSSASEAVAIARETGNERLEVAAQAALDEAESAAERAEQP